MKYKKTILVLFLTPLISYASPFVSPTGKNSLSKDQINSPFGQYNHGGHIHSGWDFQNRKPDSSGGPNVAVVSGTLKFTHDKYNTIILIPDDRSTVSQILYLHSKNIVAKEGHINAGETIAYASNTGMGLPPGRAVHLHFTVIASNNAKLPSRAIVSSSRKKMGDLVFGNDRFEGQRLNKYAVEPYPFFGVPTPFSGMGKQNGGIGNNTKEMYDTLYPNGVSSISTNSSELASSNALAAEMGIDNPTDEQKANFLFENNENSYGGVVDSFVSNEDISFNERLQNAANFRFNSESWTKSITSASNRALYADYVAANGLEVFLKNEIQKKRNHIEALFATLASQKIKEAKKNAIYAFNNSQSTNISNAIK